MPETHFTLNLKVYPLEAILSASYSFIDRAYIYLEKPSRDSVVVRLKAKKKISSAQLTKLKDEFSNELLHCSLRYQVSKNNKKLREYIIGSALYSSISAPAGLSSNEEKLTYQDDPLGIAIPWEEKYAKEKGERAA